MYSCRYSSVLMALDAPITLASSNSLYTSPVMSANTVDCDSVPIAASLTISPLTLFVAIDQIEQQIREKQVFTYLISGRDCGLRKSTVLHPSD